VVSFFCDCLNKDNPKFITLTNGNLSPKKEDINLHPSLDGDPTEKICQDTSLCKNATVFQYDKIKNDESNLTEMNKNELNTSFDDCIQNTDNIIDKIEDEFQKKTNYNETLILSSDSENDDDGAPASVLALRKNIEENINKKIFEEKEDENEKEKENEINKTNSKVSSQESIAKNGSETAPNETDDENKSQSSTADKEKSQQIDEEDSNSLDFPLDEIENHSNKVAKEDTADHTDENEEDLGSDDNFDDDNFNDDNFNDDNFNNDNFNDSANNDGEFNDNLEQVDGSKTSLKEQPCEEGEKEDEVKKNEGESEKEDKDNEGEKDEFNMEQKIMPTPTANLDEIASNFSSQISLEDTYLENAQFLNDSNDEINFIPLQEKDKSNRIRWKYHIKHHSTNKKLRCCNFLIYWSQPSKINPVPKATAEMWMIYYHTSNVCIFKKILLK